jgi:hypothetical protein
MGSSRFPSARQGYGITKTCQSSQAKRYYQNGLGVRRLVAIRCSPYGCRLLCARLLRIGRGDSTISLRAPKQFVDCLSLRSMHRSRGTKGYDAQLEGVLGSPSAVASSVPSASASGSIAALAEAWPQFERQVSCRFCDWQDACEEVETDPRHPHPKRKTRWPPNFRYLAVIITRREAGERIWLGRLDSNQDRQSQSLQCYRYTTPHRATRTGLMGGR